MPRLLPLTLLCLALALPATATAGKSSPRKSDPATGPAPTTQTPPAHLFGYNDLAVQLGQMTATEHAALVRAGGANTHRITFDWRWAEPTRGSLKLAKYDAMYDAYVAAGIKPMFVILYSPQWTWAEGTPCVQATQDCRYPPADLGAWRKIVRTLVTRYPQMAALEVWNEPNMKLFWQSGADPVHYATLVKEAYGAVRGAGSPVPVLGGSVTVPPNEPGNIHVRDFLTWMYASGVKGRMDGLSIHPYPDDLDQHRAYRMLTTAREIRDAAGDGSTPIWVSEFGSSSEQVGADGQARLLTRLHQRFREAPDVRSTIVHSLVPQARSSVFDAGYGVVTAAFEIKPAYCSLAAANGVTDACSPQATVDSTQELRWDAQDLAQAALDAARRYRAINGSYAGLTSAELNAIDPRISAVPADGTTLPGPDADPSRIGAYVWTADGKEHVEVCNTSQVDRSYCIHGLEGSYWDYGSAAGSIYQAAGATNNRASTSW